MQFVRAFRAVAVPVEAVAVLIEAVAVPTKAVAVLIEAVAVPTKAVALLIEAVAVLIEAVAVPTKAVKLPTKAVAVLIEAVAVLVKGVALPTKALELFPIKVSRLHKQAFAFPMRELAFSVENVGGLLEMLLCRSIFSCLNRKFGCVLWLCQSSL